MIVLFETPAGYSLFKVSSISLADQKSYVLSSCPKLTELNPLQCHHLLRYQMIRSWQRQIPMISTKSSSLPLTMRRRL